MKPFTWRYRKSYIFRDWSICDLLEDYRRLSKTIEDYRRLSKNILSKSIGWLIRGWLRCEVQKFIKNARHFWHLESHRAFSSRPEDLSTWVPEELRIWWSEDLRIITLMSVFEDRVDEIIFWNLFRIHDATFNSIQFNTIQFKWSKISKLSRWFHFKSVYQIRTRW
jgi:hypothetical protein